MSVLTRVRNSGVQSEKILELNVFTGRVLLVFTFMLTVVLTAEAFAHTKSIIICSCTNKTVVNETEFTMGFLQYRRIYPVNPLVSYSKILH